MELGAASNQELLQAKVDLNAAKSALIRQQLAIENQFVALNRLMNVALETTYLFPDSIPTVYSPSLEDLQAKAQSQSRTIQLAEADQRLQSFRLREEKAQRSPILNLSAAYNYNRTSSTAGFALFNQSSGPSAGLGLTWNLFQGGQLKSRIQQAELGLHQTELLVLDQRAEISSAILIAFKSWKQASVLSELEKENMGFAQENLRLATERLRLGKAGILDVKEASRSYEQAVAAWSSAVFEQKAAEVSLLQLSGDLVK
jgi:outer membrane protein TolC